MQLIETETSLKSKAVKGFFPFTRRHPLAKAGTDSNSFSSPILDLILDIFLFWAYKEGMDLHYFKIYE